MIYEGILNECVQILVINGDKIIHQHKMKINSKVSTYDFNLKMTTEGVIPIKFEIKSTCYSGIDGSVESNVKVVKVSEQRNEMLKSIEKRKVKLMIVAHPDDETLCIFEETVTPMYAQMQENEKQSVYLTKLRDILLPRLMSGDLDVSNINL